MEYSVYLGISIDIVDMFAHFHFAFVSSVFVKFHWFVIHLGIQYIEHNLEPKLSESFSDWWKTEFDEIEYFLFLDYIKWSLSR